MSFSSLPCIAFFHGSILGLSMPVPEIILQSDYHLVNVTPQAGKIRFPNKVILAVTKYEIIAVQYHKFNLFSALLCHFIATNPGAKLAYMMSASYLFNLFFPFSPIRARS